MKSFSSSFYESPGTSIYTSEVSHIECDSNVHPNPRVNVIYFTM